jgi:dUTP pyrophosphatase
MPKTKTLKIKLFDRRLPTPEYKTKGAVGFDVYLRKSVTILPRQVVLAPVNIALELPKGCFAIIAARSSMYKHGVMLANGIGIGDEDFKGDDDEYHMSLLNFTGKKVKIARGERIGQIVIANYTRAKLKLVDRLGNPTRGGFGSTGRR